MAFADHYPLSAFQDGYRTSQTGRDESKAYQEAVFFPAVEAHLLELRAAGRLGVAGGVAGREVWSADRWNKFVVTGTVGRGLIDYLASLLYHGAHVAAERGSVFDFEWRKPDTTPEQLVERAWSNLCATLDGGTTDHRWQLDSRQDTKTGDRCTLTFADWKPTLTRWTGSGFEPVQDMGAIPLAVIEIDCPSGELILTDVMGAADDAFRDAIDLGERAFTIASLNSDQGCINHSTLIAAEYGFASIATDNTSVVVHRQGDRLVVSERWADEELRLADEDGDVTVKGWDKVGRFSCDRWIVEIMDRQVATDILARHGVEDPAGAIDEWIAAEDDEVVVMKVTPGRYRIHFGPAFSERFDRMTAGIPNGPQPWLMMEPVA